jgi:hypothetical protein
MYKYRPLSSGRFLRILVLQPSFSLDAPVHVQLEERTLPELNDHPAGYEALSYVWGATVGTEPIVCEDQTLLVTANCLAALKFLRHKKEVRRL